MTGKLVAELENNMTSVDRIMEYTDIKPEAPRKTLQDKVLPLNWPVNGEIEYRNMSLQYPMRDTLTLRNVSCIIKAGEKIAIVGKTGAGKSSFLSSLCRIHEAVSSGMIYIDQCDIRNLGLQTLRQKISVIPQEAFLFKGSVRFNLDPFDEHSDQKIWSSLASVQLFSKIKRYRFVSFPLMFFKIEWAGYTHLF